MKPYLSIVIPCRNDFYAGSMLEKLMISLKKLMEQIVNNKIPTEIIVVDWNPPPGICSLSEELRNIQLHNFILLKAIQVSAEIHSRYKYSKNRSLIGEVAANVGIRRAKGKFVMIKVADSFYSDDLVKYIGKQQLNKNCVYRVDRLDISGKIKIDQNWEEEFSKKLIYRHKANKNGPHTRAAGDFILMSKISWIKIRGFPETNKVISLGGDGEALWAAIGLGLKEVQLPDPYRVYKIAHSGMHANRVINKKNTQLIAINDLLKKYFFYKHLRIMIEIILGIFNLPPTRISGVKTRSEYRYKIVCWIRGNIPSIKIFGNKKWGLLNEPLKIVIIFDGLTVIKRSIKT
jgi:hypothetical protein